MSLATILALRARVRVLERELAATTAELAAYRRLRTLGGPPPPYQQPLAWANVTTRPDSADDPSAPPRVTRRGSDAHRR